MLLSCLFDLRRRRFASYVRARRASHKPKISSMVPTSVPQPPSSLDRAHLYVVVLGIVRCKPSPALPRWGSPDMARDTKGSGMVFRAVLLQSPTQPQVCSVSGVHEPIFSPFVCPAMPRSTSTWCSESWYKSIPTRTRWIAKDGL